MTLGGCPTLTGRIKVGKIIYEGVGGWMPAFAGMTGSETDYFLQMMWRCHLGEVCGKSER
jgi:hypothetical protein